MPITVQDFVADATLKASKDLTTAFLRIPEDKRDWSPDGKARTALDQYAECALLCGDTAETIQSGLMAASQLENFFHAKDELKAQDWERIHALLGGNAAKAADVIRAVTEEGLNVVITTPWRPMTVAQMITYPHWNMTYHEGQINYVASLLGCLE